MKKKGRPDEPELTPAPEAEPATPAARAAAEGAKRYIPQPPARDLNEFGGGSRERLANAGQDANELIPDYKEVLSQEELLNTKDAMRLYNDGMSAEQFLMTPVGQRLSKRVRDDQDAFQALALKHPDLNHPDVVAAHKKAYAAEYFYVWLAETLAAAEQAQQTLRIADENEKEG